MPLPALLAHAAALALAALVAPSTGSAPIGAPVSTDGSAAAAAETTVDATGPAPGTATGTAPGTAPSAAWPLDPEPEVLAGFDPPDTRWGAGHRGVDLVGRPGQPVLAALPGRVGFAGTVAGKPVVTVLHGDLRTTYEPVVATVRRGDRVAAGVVLGRLVLADGHCLPVACLHWGLRRGEDYLDPLSLLGAGPVRLLPLWHDLP